MLDFMFSSPNFTPYFVISQLKGHTIITPPLKKEIDRLLLQIDHSKNGIYFFPFSLQFILRTNQSIDLIIFLTTVEEGC